MRQNLNFQKWPFSALDHVKKGGHYIYFDSSSKLSSLLLNDINLDLAKLSIFLIFSIPLILILLKNQSLISNIKL